MFLLYDFCWKRLKITWHVYFAIIEIPEPAMTSSCMASIQLFLDRLLKLYFVFRRNPVNCSWSTDNPSPPPLFLIFLFFNAYFIVRLGWKVNSMSPYFTLKSLVDKVFLSRRARKGAHGVEDPCRMPCKVRKEVRLDPPAGARIRIKGKNQK